MILSAKPQAALLAALILASSGWLYGTWSGRWQPDEALQAAVAKVALVPRNFGDWKSETLDSDAEDFDLAGAQSYWTRRYAHHRGGDSFLVILMCGQAKHMAVHTPEACYRGAGFTLVSGSPELCEVPWEEIAVEKKATFWTGQFRKDAGQAGGVCLFWSWNSNGSWQAFKNPRADTSGQPFLYKMYISQDLPATMAPRAGLGEPAREFLQELIPVLQKTLFPEAKEKD